jgi:hypothetical protein
MAVKITLPPDLITSIGVNPPFLGWGNWVTNPGRIISRKEHTNTHSITFTFYGKTDLQLQMETRVTFTFHRENCQCIAQEAVLRYHQVDLGGTLFQQHISVYTDNTIPNFS